MRILYVSPFPPARDGIGTYTEAIIKELRANGHEACVIAARSESLGNPDVARRLAHRARRPHHTPRSRGCLES